MPLQSRWQLPLLCKLAGAYLPRTIVHITYSLDALLPFGDQRPHLGRRAFGAVGRHIRTMHRLGSTCNTCLPATHLPTHNCRAHPTTQMPKFPSVKDSIDALFPTGAFFVTTRSTTNTQLLWFTLSTRPQCQRIHIFTFQTVQMYNLYKYLYIHISLLS